MTTLVLVRPVRDVAVHLEEAQRLGLTFCSAEEHGGSKDPYHRVTLSGRMVSKIWEYNRWSLVSRSKRRLLFYLIWLCGKAQDALNDDT